MFIELIKEDLSGTRFYRTESEVFGVTIYEQLTDENGVIIICETDSSFIERNKKITRAYNYEQSQNAAS